jgi:membrane associated rhomboid family serine protease
MMAALSGPRAQGGQWMARGLMDAEAALQGQWHRLFTAVTLHADGAHLASNAVFLLVVAPTLVHRFGAGVTALSLLTCGAAGNAVTAAYHGVGFSNVGASGGVFGLACMLGMLAARTRKSRMGANRWVLGVGAALALLSLLGFGERADVVAHLAGFAAGVPLGLLLPIGEPSSRRPGWLVWQTLTGCLTVGLLVLAWLRAWQ